MTRRKHRSRDGEPPWPGDPAQAWERAAEALPIRRLRAPDVLADYPTFTRHVEPAQRPGGPGMLAFGLFLLACVILDEGFRGRVGEQGVLRALFLGNPWNVDLALWAGVLLTVIGAFGTVLRPRNRERMMRDLFEQARHVGVIAKVFDSGHRITVSESGELHVHYAVDTTIDGTRAARLIRAIDLWVDALRADRSADSSFGYRLDREITVSSASVFGPEAAGAVIYLEGLPVERRSYPWRLMLPAAQSADTTVWIMHLIR